MAEKDSQGPSLELPSLFRRKRAQEPQHTAESTDRTEPPAEPTEDVRPAASADDQETAPLPAAQPDPAPAPEAAAAPPATSAPTETSAAEQTGRPRPRLTLPSVGAFRGVRREDGSAASAESSGDGPQPRPESRPEPEPVTNQQDTREQEPVTPAAAAATHATATPTAAAPMAERTSTPAVGTATQEHPADRRVTAPDDRRRRSRATLPDLAAATASLVVGAAVGLLGVVLTFLGLQGCQLVAGTSSCGGPGLLVLVAIFVAMVLAGAAALKLFGVPEAGSVSFLGTGLLMVILLMFFLEALDHASMVFVIPALAAPCFALARWVTTQLSEDVMEDR